MRLEFENYGQVFTAKLDDDSDMTIVMIAIRGALISMGYSPVTVEEYIKID